MKREISKRKERRDNFIVEFLLEHKGRDKCVSSKSICEFLESNGYKMNPTSLFPNIHRIMYENDIPICYISMKGYYVAENEDDVLPVIEDLQKRINGFQKHIDFLQKFIH